jgi:Flp pilus assembly protein TadB
MNWGNAGKEWPTAALFILTFYVVTITAFVNGAAMNTLFRTLAQAIVITGLIGIALAYHYRGDALKNDEIDRLRRENAELMKRVGRVG